MAASDKDNHPKPSSRWVETLLDKPLEWLQARLTYFEDKQRNSLRQSADRTKNIRELRLIIRARLQAQDDAAAAPLLPSPAAPASASGLALPVSPLPTIAGAADQPVAKE